MTAAWVYVPSSHFSPVHYWSWLMVLQGMGGTSFLSTSIMLRTSNNPELSLALWSSDPCYTNCGPCTRSQPHLGACQKCVLLGSTQSLLNPTLYSNPVPRWLPETHTDLMGSGWVQGSALVLLVWQRLQRVSNMPTRWTHRTREMCSPLPRCSNQSLVQDRH